MYVKNVHPQYKTSLDIIDMGGSGGGAREQQDQDDAEATEEHGDVKLSQSKYRYCNFIIRCRWPAFRKEVKESETKSSNNICLNYV